MNGNSEAFYVITDDAKINCDANLTLDKVTEAVFICFQQISPNHMALKNNDRVKFNLRFLEIIKSPLF